MSPTFARGAIYEINPRYPFWAASALMLCTSDAPVATVEEGALRRAEMPSQGTELPLIRRVAAGDGPIVRDLYIQMLLDTPDAFGELLAEAQGRTPEDWSRLVELCAEGTDVSSFLAEDDQGVCGFVRGDASDPRTPPGTVLVSQLWAAPRQRGRGLGRELMNAVTRWAEDCRAARICLGVTETNLGVLAFYERLGYADTGIRMPLVPNHKLQVVVMARPLGS